MIPRLNEKEQQILTLLVGDPNLSVTDLARELEVSSVTMRGYLNALAEKGYLYRVHGGAVPTIHPEIVEREQSTPAGETGNRPVRGFDGGRRGYDHDRGRHHDGDGGALSAGQTGRQRGDQQRPRDGSRPGQPRPAGQSWSAASTDRQMRASSVRWLWRFLTSFT
jgi:DNA-binding transcriptional MocR family regulator